jgi:allantoinase
MEYFNTRLEYFITSNSVVVGNKLIPAALRIRNGKIVEITTRESAIESGLHLNDYGSLVIMAGLVDSHVHVNEPGRTHWEGFESATKAACAGGVTTIVDMPLNSSPVTTTLDALEKKISAKLNKLWIDVALLGGVIPGNSKELIPMTKRGVVGFKCFMVHSGIDDFPCAEEDDIKAAIAELSQLDNPVPLMFHAELAGPIDSCASQCASLPPNNYFTFLSSRPEEAEVEAISKVVQLCGEFGKNKVPCHIVHLSSGSAVPLIKKAQQTGTNLTCETTYHYLSLVAEEIPDGNTRFKCCPPIRKLNNREILWKALHEGVIKCAVSDHSPSTLDLKGLESGNFMKAWGGIASLQLGLFIVWTEAQKRGWTIPDVAKIICEEPSKLVQLDDIKGTLELGKDADIVIWDPDYEFTVTAETLHMKNAQACPYVGLKLKGKVKATILRGEYIYEDDKFTKELPIGRWVTNKFTRETKEKKKYKF